MTADVRGTSPVARGSGPRDRVGSARANGDANCANPCVSPPEPVQDAATAEPVRWMDHGLGGLMISELTNMPPGVVGFEVRGKVEATDYRDVVLPALERAFESGEIRFLIVMADFAGMSGGAIWQDLKLGFEHLRAWKRTAVVTDLEWVTHLTGLFGWMTPGETKTFPMDQRDEAVTWVAG
jgi:hypothetical protein